MRSILKLLAGDFGVLFPNDSCWSQQLSLADSCSVRQLNGGIDGRLDNGLKDDGGCSNGQQLSSADSWSLTATDGFDDGGCHNGSAYGSSNGYSDYVLGVAHNTLHTLANIVEISNFQSQQRITMCFNKAGQTLNYQFLHKISLVSLF